MAIRQLKETNSESKKVLTWAEIDEHPEIFHPINGSVDTNRIYEEHADVKDGSWIIVIRTIPVEAHVAPKLYGIYWGMPKEDRFGRQVCMVHTSEDVTLLNHEFNVIDEERLEHYKNMAGSSTKPAAP